MGTYLYKKKKARLETMLTPIEVIEAKRIINQKVGGTYTSTLKESERVVELYIKDKKGIVVKISTFKGVNVGEMYLYPHLANKHITLLNEAYSVASCYIAKKYLN